MCSCQIPCTGEVSLSVLPALFGCLWSLRSTPCERVEKLRALFGVSFGIQKQLDISFEEFMKTRKHRMINISEDRETCSERDFLGVYLKKCSFSAEFARCVYEVVSGYQV